MGAVTFFDNNAVSGVATEGYGGKTHPQTFCHNGASDFFKINRKIVGRGQYQIFREVEGAAKNFIDVPTFIAMASSLNRITTQRYEQQVSIENSTI